MRDSRWLRIHPAFLGLFTAGLSVMPLSCQSTHNGPADTTTTGGSTASGGQGSSSGGTTASGGRASGDGGADALGGQGPGGSDAFGGQGGKTPDGGSDDDHCFGPSSQVECVDYEVESTVCFTLDELSDPCSVVHLLRVHSSSGVGDPVDLRDEQLNDSGDTQACPAADELYFGRFFCGLGVTPACENASQRVGNTCCYLAYSDTLLC